MGYRMAEEAKEIVVQENTNEAEAVEIIILVPRDSDADWEWMQKSIAKFLLPHMEQEFILHGRTPRRVAVVFAAKHAPFYLKNPVVPPT